MPYQNQTDWLRSQVHDALTAFFAEHSAPVGDPEVTAAFTVLRDFVLDGGKRLRPVLCFWGWRGAGGHSLGGREGASCRDRPIVSVAAALELCHAGLLIHDDIMDGSDLRRGRPTVHRALGQSAAILLGVLALAWSDEVFAGCGADPVRLRAARRRFDRMRTEVIAGQFLDVLARAGDAPERALTAIRYKTAKYTVERPLQIGGELAGAGPELLAAYSRLGLPLGEAFQLRDDLLGVFGDPAETGKSALDDLREGRHTLLIAHAWQHASPAAARHLRLWYGSAGLTERAAETIRQILLDTGAVAHVETMIADRVRQALEVLRTAPITPEARQALTRLADGIANRTR